MKWEYTTYCQSKNFGPLTGDSLNKIGEQAWELVCVIEMREDWIYTFKRRRRVALGIEEKDDG